MQFAMRIPGPNGEALEFVITTSETIGELVKAIAQATLKYGPLKKESSNPYFKSRYADLSALIEATAKPLAENEVAVFQFPLAGGVSAGVATLIGHASNEWMCGALMLPMTKPDAQGAGSAITYARRYSEQAMLNIAADVDDDANAATGRQQQHTMPFPKSQQRFEPKKEPEVLQKKVKKPTKAEEPSFKQKFWAAAKREGPNHPKKTDDEIREFLSSMEVEHTEDVPAGRQDEAMEWASEEVVPWPE